MQCYGGIDLHARNNLLVVIDEQDQQLYRKRLDNDPSVILGQLAPFKESMVGVVIESTFNWYWLADSLMDVGYRTHLANPSAMKRYSGLKHSDDKYDALWLAQQLRLGILPEGFIYPKEDRPVRDLLRTRVHLVKLRTALINRINCIIRRNGHVPLTSAEIKLLRQNRLTELAADSEDIRLNGQAGKDVIDHLTAKINEIQKQVMELMEPRPQLARLRTMPGVGEILSLTIMLETGDIGRFPKVGNFASYCRKVNTRWESDGKQKGRGNRKNGNKYLAWAFSQAAEKSRRYDEKARAFYNRKASRTSIPVAFNALAHKLVRAAYYIMRDCVCYDGQKLFR